MDFGRLLMKMVYIMLIDWHATARYIWSCLSVMHQLHLIISCRCWLC